jgi:hypothetical protein
MAGRQETPADRLALNKALEDFRQSDFHFKQLVVSLTRERQVSLEGRAVNVASNH